MLTDIQRDILDDRISLGSILRKSQVLAYDLKNPEFKTWVNYELDGYPVAAKNFEAFIKELPPYRYAEALVKGDAIGPFGSGARNYPIPSHVLPDELRIIWFVEGCPSLEQMIKHGGHEKYAIVAWSERDVEIFNEVNQGSMPFVTINKMISIAFVIDILQTVRNRLLNFTLELRDAYPELELDTRAAANVSPREIEQIFHVSVLQGGQLNMFNQQGQHIGRDQYNAAGNINFDGIQTIQQLGEEIDRFQQTLAASEEFAAVDEGARVDVEYNLKRAALESKKPDAKSDIVRNYLETGKQILADLAQAAGLVAALQKLIEIVNHLPH